MTSYVNMLLPKSKEGREFPPYFDVWEVNDILMSCDYVFM